MSLSAHVQEGFLAVKREGVPPHNDCRHTPTVQTVKNPPAMWEIWAIPGWGRSPGGEHGNLLQ